ncbi:hypothetical protein J5N97_011793 [Dioscorea zingiberensis]|uniref:S-locus receptor kinase n=1 Tax=Dioscorea zingiberensis TaxID=325984 RepID=A0A9D5HNY4_9LILI|nr:hypothetical protein J5N97_011793 [Dioscorea zingiberensis]
MQESNNSSFHDRSNQWFASGNDHLELSQKNDLELPLHDFGTILSATENFSANNKLGEGGFGPVYKVWNSWKEGNSLQMVDESMGYSYPINEVMSCIKVGLLCVQNHPEDRPLMPSVLVMLSGDSALLPYPKEPGFAVRSVPYQMESVSSKPNSSSTYDMSVTLVQGR